MDLLNLPISFFAGLISLVFGLFVKSGLWSFPSVRSYTLLLIEKIELVIKIMRCKVHFYNNDEEINEVPENHSLKSLNCLQQIKELSAFENELFKSLNIIKFRKVHQHKVH